MPELPEVEHARRRFLAMSEGEVVLDAAALDPIVIPQDHRAWRESIVGRQVEGAERIGKNVLVYLSGERALWFHLGMTGRVVRQGAPDEASDESGLPRFTRWWIETSRARVCLCDGRRLGRCMIGTLSEMRSRLAELGPDALAITTPAQLAERLASARGPIKAALMDQARIAGLGNIQAAEALWLAKIHPELPVPKMNQERWARLQEAVTESLQRSLSSMGDSETLVYVEAGGPNPFLVYGREGEPCPRCRAKIVREVARGRASYLCGRCQRAPASR